MDKNVGSVNLDELKAAREALDRERGIETDPNLYNDYDPEKHKAEKEQEKLARQQALDEATGDVSAETSQAFDAEKNESVEELSNNVQSAEVLENASETVQETTTASTEEPAALETVNLEPENVMPQESVSTDDSSSESGDSTSMLDIFKEFEINDSPETVSQPETVDEPSVESMVAEPSQIETIEINEVEAPMTANSEVQPEEQKTETVLSNDFARSPEVEKLAVQEDSSSTNFDVYDNFADFEVNSADQVQAVAQESVSQPEPEVETTQTEKSTEVALEEKSVDKIDLSENNSLDEFLSELDSILAMEESEDEDLEIVADSENKESVDDTEIIDSTNTESSVEEKTEILAEDKSSNEEESLESLLGSQDDATENVEIENVEEDKSSLVNVDVEPNIQTEETVKETIEESSVEDVSIEEPSVEEVKTVEPLEDEFGSNLERFSVSAEEIKENEDIDFNASQTEVLTDFSKLGSIAEEIEQEEQKLAEMVEEEAQETIEVENDDLAEDVSEEAAETEDVEVGGYQKIEEFNFVDIMSTEEFKEEDPLSYVLGKDDEGKIVYSNLRDTCGTAVFAKDEDIVFEQFSSILLSLLLKNSSQDIQFVVCDAMFDSSFDVFKNSSYMYFNRVAKNNREIVDSLLELSKELENRYHNLVYSGVKSISAYNMQAEERGTQKMPYIVLFMNNYAKMTQFLDADRINNCLYNILKFGRLVGVYAILASTSEIERDDINFNLPTRISYLAEDAHESIAALGREGAENLKDERDFLYSTVYDEELRHLKVPSLTRKEIELIIENLEV